MTFFAKTILENIGQRLWGFKPLLMAHIVDQKGGFTSLRWFAGNMPVYEKILKNWGPVRTHLIAVTASLINGCAYCSFGHAFAFQLHYFKNTGELFPLSDEEMLQLRAHSSLEIVDKLCEVLQQADLGEEIKFVRRTAVLMSEPDHSQVASNNEDEYILHLIGMFKMLNACGIKDDVVPDEAHDPINKNKALIAKYHSQRSKVATDTLA